MSKENVESDQATWNELAEAYGPFSRARRAFLASGVNRVNLIRKALPTTDKALAFCVAQHLTQAEHMQLFDEWVRYAAIESYFKEAHRFILSLPREWVMERIEQVIEPYLLDADEFDFRYYLDLYYELDRALAAKLAQRAANHPDKSIREVGDEYLSLLEGQ